MPDVLGRISTQSDELDITAYGGRAEVRLRRDIQEVVYYDIKSMYPTVNALMGLWELTSAVRPKRGALAVPS